MSNTLKYSKQVRVDGIKAAVATLNMMVQDAAYHGITTEYLLDNVDDPNAFHQIIRVVVSERF